MTKLQEIKSFNTYTNHAKEEFLFTFEQWAINKNHPADEWVQALRTKLSKVDHELIDALPVQNRNNYEEIKRLLLEKYKPEDLISLLSTKLSAMRHNLDEQTVEEFVAEYKSIAKKVYPGQNKDFLRLLMKPILKSRIDQRLIKYTDTSNSIYAMIVDDLVAAEKRYKRDRMAEMQIAEVENQQLLDRLDELLQCDQEQNRREKQQEKSIQEMQKRNEAMERQIEELSQQTQGLGTSSQWNRQAEAMQGNYQNNFNVNNHPLQNNYSRPNLENRGNMPNRGTNNMPNINKGTCNFCHRFGALQ